MVYPEARKGEVVDVYFGTSVADPYRWMEDVDSEEVQRWVEAENGLTQEFLADVPARARIHARLLELNDYERVGMPRRDGGRYSYARNTGLQNQSVLFWQEGAEGEAKVLLDPNQLAEDATVSLSSYALSDDGTLMAYALAEAGSDVQTVRVKVVASGEELADEVKWVKFSGVIWAKDGKGFYYSSFGAPHDLGDAGVLKNVAVGHKFFFHQLGTPQAADTVVFERADDGELLVSGGVSDDGRWLVLGAGKGHTNSLVVKDLAQPERGLIPLAPVEDAIHGWLGNVGSRVWLETNKDAPHGRVVEVDLEQVTADETGAWKTVIAEGAEPIDSVVMVGGRLVVVYLQDAKNRVEIRTLAGELEREVVLPGIGRVGVGGGRAEDTDLFLAFTNYTTPGAVYRLELGTGELVAWKHPRLVFEPAEYETTQLFATSKDGTRVPLFVTSKKGLVLDGTAPAILYGYGGFGISLGPAYASSRLAWMEMGALYAEAILRGGGEYGEDWHQAGTKVRKQNVFDDFIACAELLIAGKYTSAEKLAINGGSNGGLLAAACALQRPELFAASVPQVGVLDMLRFDQFTIGYAWKPEYGSPQTVEEEFHALLAYSPLQNVRAGLKYPAMLVMTADHDDRVFPAHSFKFTAAMQAVTPEEPVLIRVETRAGHGAGMPLSKQLEGTADLYGFLVKVLGMAG